MEATGFGVIGAGTWGALHARVYADLAHGRLAAVCDSDLARAEAVAASSGARAYSRVEDLLADPSVCAVSIVLPDHLHEVAAVAAARAGKHVLVEKPLATTEAGCRAIIEAAERSGVCLFVDFHNRWSPLFCALKDALDAGELGDPRVVTYRLNDTLFVPTRMLSWAASSTVAWFLASHCLDTLLWLRNAREGSDSVERVTCLRQYGILREQLGVDTPDAYLTTLEWRSGMVTYMENCWILPECGPSVFDLECRVIGTKGSFKIDGSHHGAALKLTDRPRNPDILVAPTIHGRPSGFAAESIRHFAHSVMTGSTPAVDGADGLAVTRLILKMEESAEAGQPVKVGPLYDP